MEIGKEYSNFFKKIPLTWNEYLKALSKRLNKAVIVFDCITFQILDTLVQREELISIVNDP
jgi:hypothetical protein